jgi:RNA polymerase sigma-70 factor (ECF subfamily)
MSGVDPDAVLVARVLAGRQEAYTELVRRHQQGVYWALYRMLGDARDAEDIAQDSFVRAYVALPGFDPRYRFASWLYQIAINLAINRRRQRCRELLPAPDPLTDESFFERLPNPDPQDHPAAVAEANDVADQLRRSVMALPPDYRDVLIMRHVMELGYAEISQATGLPIGTVKSRLDRARRRLAELVGPWS